MLEDDRVTLGSTFQHSPVMIHAAWSGHCREMERNSYGWDEIDWPSTEAMELVAAILSYRGSEDAGVLRVAVEKWSSSNTNPTAMMTRLSWLREVLQDQATVGLRPMYSGSFHELVDYVMACASQAAVQQLETVAHLDQLTGCGNRMAMEVDVQRQLAHASRAHQKLAVAVLDLDGLKEINDGQGHQAGDASLRKLVKVVSEVLRETDSIFRIGGDEFVLLLPLASGEEDVDAMMERALENGAPSFSWGVATYPHDGSNFEQLFEVADRQLYQRRAAVRKIVSMAVAAGVVGGVETGVVGAAGVVGGETGGEEVGEETKIVDITVARKWRERAIEWMNERTVAVGTSIAVLVLVVFTVMLLANALGGKQHNTGLNSSAPTPITSIPKRGSSTTTPLQGSSRGSSSGVSGSSTGTSVPFGTGQITSANDSGVPAGNQRAVSGTGSSGAPTTTSSAGSNGAGQGNSGTGSGGGSGSGGGTGTGTGTGTGGGGTGTGTGSGSGTGTGTGTGGGLVGGLTHTLSKVPLVGGVVGTLGNVLGTSSASSNQPSGSSTGSSSGNGGSATGSSSSTGSSSPTSTGSGSSGSGSSSGSSGGLLGGLLGSL